MAKTTAYTDGSGEALIDEFYDVRNHLDDVVRDLKVVQLELRQAWDEIHRLRARIEYHLDGVEGDQ